MLLVVRLGVTFDGTLTTSLVDLSPSIETDTRPAAATPSVCSVVAKNWQGTQQQGEVRAHGSVE